MSKIFFSDELIVVVPSYSQTEMHKHNMLHIFVGEEMLKMEIDGDIIEGKNIVLEQDVIHKGPVGKLNYFLFVDATSSFADLLRNKWLKTKRYAVINSDCLNIQEISEDSIKQIISDFFGRDSLMRRATIDERITEALNEIDSFKCLGVKVPELANRYSYSESFFTHLFKKETGISLKSYLLMKQFEFAWKEISKGKKITDAVMDAGFASPSHFSDVCRRMTGISAVNVLKKADL
jgi:AraC-like DNA-binding protein